MRLLVAEDDAALRSVLGRGLTKHGYVVDATARGDEAPEWLDRLAGVLVDNAGNIASASTDVVTAGPNA